MPWKTLSSNLLYGKRHSSFILLILRRLLTVSIEPHSENCKSLWSVRKDCINDKMLYTQFDCSVLLNTKETDWFAVNSGVRQGCITSPILLLIAISEFGIPSAIGILGRVKRSSGKKWMFWMFRSTVIVYQIGHGWLVLWRFLPLEGTRAERISSRSWTQNNRKESRVGGTCIRRKPDWSQHEMEFDRGKREKQTRLFRIAKNKWWHNTRSSVLERGECRSSLA